jgi:hypothetical protein
MGIESPGAAFLHLIDNDGRARVGCELLLVR